MTLWQVTTEMTRRLITLFTRDADGRRPVNGDREKFQSDPHWRDLDDVPRVLPRRHRRGPRRRAPDRLDRRRRQAHPPVRGIRDEGPPTRRASSGSGAWDRTSARSDRGCGTEWLEPDGDGGFASGTVGGYRTRRYHALLLPATTPPTGAFVLVNGFEAWLDLARRPLALSTQHYAPDVVYPRGVDHLDGVHGGAVAALDVRAARTAPTIVHEIVVAHARGHGRARGAASRGAGRAAAQRAAAAVGPRLPRAHARERRVRFHARSRTAATSRGIRTAGVPRDRRAVDRDATRTRPTGTATSSTREEAARGLDCVEDLAAPGVFTFDLDAARRRARAARRRRHRRRRAQPRRGDVRAAERKRRAVLARSTAPPTRIIVRRGDRRHTIVAGYPWFTDWGRDTFIAMRGLVLARGRADVASIDPRRLVGARLAGHAAQPLSRRRRGAAIQRGRRVAVVRRRRARVHGGRGATPPMRCAERGATRSSTATRAARASASAWTRDGLLACGEPGVQLTWMDARVDDRVITPRIGKPVEVQALWINALRLAGAHAPQAERATASFRARFCERRARRACTTWSTPITCRAASTRACGPTRSSRSAACRIAIVDGDAARAVVDDVEAELVTPAGLRSLAPRPIPPIARATKAASAQRDGAYHQGTVWPWLTGAFVDAWLRVHGNDAAARERRRASASSTPLARARRRGGDRPPVRDRRRRRAAHAARLPVPGVVAGRADPGAHATMA